VEVRSWSSAESHVAGCHGFWATGGGEAQEPPAKGEQPRRPPHPGHPAASTCSPRQGSKREPGVSVIAQATEAVKTLAGPPRRTRRRRGSGMLGAPSGPHGSPRGVTGRQGVGGPVSACAGGVGVEAQHGAAGGEPPARWWHAPVGDSAPWREERPAGVPTRHRAAVRGERPAGLIRVSAPTPRGARGAGGQGGPGRALGGSRC
jgi:hypothetical protein